MSKKLKRRDILKGSLLGAAALNPYFSIFDKLVESLISNAQAATGNKNIIIFLSGGAPPRWAFDCFLNPSGDLADFVANNSAQNFLEKAGAPLSNYSGLNAETLYKTSPYNYKKNGLDKTIHLSAGIDMTIPHYQGANVVTNNSLKLRDLLQHTMLIRGIDMGVDVGHLKGAALMPKPESGLKSTTGHIGDLSTTKIPAVGNVHNYRFKTGFVADKASIVLTQGNNPLNDILKSFDKQESTAQLSHSNNRLLLQSAMDRALNKLEEYSIARNPAHDKLWKNRKDAKSVIERFALDLGDYSSEFNTLKSKYNALVKECALQPVSGLIPIMNSFNTRNGDIFSQHFALVEYLLSKGLSSSFTFSLGTQTAPGDALLNDMSTVSISNFNDEHIQGDRQKSLISANFYYRSLYSCINELHQSLGDSIMQNTIIQNGSEFGRKPRDTTGTRGALGTEHSPNSNSTFIYSGAIKEFIPIGNAKRSENPSGHSFHGSWGQSSATYIKESDSNETITPQHVNNSICDILEISRIFRTPALIEKDKDGEWVSCCEDPKNV